MTITRILREQTIGETRWLAHDGEGLPAALYLERATDTAALGARLAGRIGKSEPGAGGTFIDIPGTHGAFLRTGRESAVPSEGSAVTVEIISEARAEKLPRVRIVPSGAPAAPIGAQAWLASLRGGSAAPVEDVMPGDSQVSAAIEDALAPDVVLSGGGRLRLERTRALTAADIDSAGRSGRGSAGARALALNRDAAGELARQILLRGLGGLFVLDCVSPIAGEGAAKIRGAFMHAWESLTTRQTKALPPSSLGLMEISTDWSITPLAERMLDTRGAPTAETIALEGLRQLEKAARENRLGRLELALPEPAWNWLESSELQAGEELNARYGARLRIRVHAGAGFEVSPAT